MRSCKALGSRRLASGCFGSAPILHQSRAFFVGTHPAHLQHMLCDQRVGTEKRLHKRTDCTVWVAMRSYAHAVRRYAQRPSLSSSVAESWDPAEKRDLLDLASGAKLVKPGATRQKTTKDRLPPRTHGKNEGYARTGEMPESQAYILHAVTFMIPNTSILRMFNAV